ncbi:hypothetical protein H7J06_18285 [Mycobacterium hodleri]|uniref:hypothetical protein n=1 Tax=Mycolicibacterium hodleri TaxID=49897 RepID=UPI0021F2D496|nr:hypothetical protein [Mycolicibacterium hodleri]MCV7134933.1 hypothetical protein [Mycolicibacterium hodleri]
MTYSETCSAPAKGRAGFVPTVAGSRLDGPGRAIVRLELMGVTKAVAMVYEDGG